MACKMWVASNARAGVSCSLDLSTIELRMLVAQRGEVVKLSDGVYQVGDWTYTRPDKVEGARHV